jgi:hypothetical protein
MTFQRDALRRIDRGQVLEFRVTLRVLQHQQVRHVFDAMQGISVSIRDQSHAGLTTSMSIDGPFNELERFPASACDQYIQLAHCLDSRFNMA